jgi:hypothetical protein
MKRLALSIALATTALSGCAQFKEWHQNANAHAGATALELQPAYPRSSSNIAGN